ncbi:MAG TPA: hypothetical protein VH278_15965 [Burkholderiaceae bacterium]|jgi:hypothetical protein|nr:hypothetical protein [Burkholderiaceae bacterium]
MQARSQRREVLPFLLMFGALAAVALVSDALLHATGRSGIARYLGIPGALLIVTSFGYSLRKRKAIRFGRPAQWLRVHEAMAWFGSALVLVHSGLILHAVLAWLALGAMLINVVSGLTGQFLLSRSRRRLEQARQAAMQPIGPGPSARELEEQLLGESLTFQVVKQWRTVHLPITLAFAALATAHIVAELLFWSGH